MSGYQTNVASENTLTNRQNMVERGNESWGAIAIDRGEIVTNTISHRVYFCLLQGVIKEPGLHCPCQSQFRSWYKRIWVGGRV